jgi:hypothetical protein
MSDEVQGPAVMVGMEPSAKYSTMQEYVPKDRQLVINWPGLISVAGDRGYFPGCRMVRFEDFMTPVGLSTEDTSLLQKQCLAAGPNLTWMTNDIQTWPAAADQLNVFAQWRGNLNVVDWRIDNSGKYHLLITTQLDAENLEDFQFAGQVLERAMRERKEERAATREELKAAEAKAELEMRDLVEVGKKAREHNLFQKLRDLEVEVLELKRQVKQAKKGG